MDSKKHDKEIAARMKAKLTEKRIKLCTVAAKLGVSQNTIYSKMQGKAPISCAELTLIAASCQFTFEDVNFVLFG